MSLLRVPADHFNHTNHTKIARLLLDAGADPNKRCGSGFTAIHRAAKANNVGVLREIAWADRVNPKWDAIDARGESARDLGLKLDHKEVVALLDSFARGKIPKRRRSSSKAVMRPSS